MYALDAPPHVRKWWLRNKITISYKYLMNHSIYEKYNKTKCSTSNSKPETTSTSLKKDLWSQNFIKHPTSLATLLESEDIFNEVIYLLLSSVNILT